MTFGLIVKEFRQIDPTGLTPCMDKVRYPNSEK